MSDCNLQKQAYIIGVALGDGNLSNPNGRAVRLRVTLDNNYPKIIKAVIKNLEDLFPKNKISLVKRSDNCVDISLYSNKIEEIIPWKVGKGSKIEQNVRVPQWIKNDSDFSKSCLKGLIETDGSIYFDGKYKMINFTNNIQKLALDVKIMMESLGYKPKLHKTKNPSGSTKYTVRLTGDTDNFMRDINLIKH